MKESSNRSQSRYGSFNANRTTSMQPKPKPPSFSNQMGASFKQLGQAIDRLFPNYQTVDAMAFSLDKYTPHMIGAAFLLLITCVVASRFNLVAEGFLWGIPSLGAVAMWFSFWACTSNIILRTDLSHEAREAVNHAMRLQWSVPVGSGIVLIYFVGMMLHVW